MNFPAHILTGTRRLVMRTAAPLMLAFSLVNPGQTLFAERYKAIVSPDSPEGQFLDLVSLQSDESKKLALIEQFAQRFSKSQAVAWAYEQIQLGALASGQWDKALTFGERLMEINPDDLDTVQLNIKAAESKHDTDAVKRWSSYAEKISTRIVDSAPPKDPEELEAWKKRVTYASQITAQGDYALFKKALETADPREKVRLFDEVLKRNPDTPYLAQMNVLYLNSYRQMGDSRKAFVYAEKVLEKDPSNEDALMTLADGYSQRGGASDRVMALAPKIIELMHTKAKPAEISQAVWDKKKAFYAGTSHWMMGNVFINQSRFGQADNSLRAASQLLRGYDQSMAAVLFYLGWANYKLDNVSEATRFFQQCLGYRSQYTEQAAKNLNVIKAEHPGGQE
ncbi:MAG: tetratricopeptide repeat protein [Bryobacteraceae bacterium]